MILEVGHIRGCDVGGAAPCTCISVTVGGVSQWFIIRCLALPCAQSMVDS